MKDILKSALGTVIGIITLNIILGVFIILIVSVAAAGSASSNGEKGDKNKGSKDHQVIHLTFSDVPDRSPSGFADLNIFNLSEIGSKKIGLIDYLDIIVSAKENDRIKGIYMDLNYVWSNWSNIEELKQALVDFKSSGKFIIAYGDFINKKAYDLATVSDKVYLTPTGVLEFNGLNASVTFFKKALEKLGIEVQVFKYGKFKSAVEPFILEKMSESNKKQLGALIETIYIKFLDGISAARGLMASDLDRLANELAVSSPEAAIEYGLIDALKYKDEVMQEINQMAFGKDTTAEVRFVSMQKLAKKKWSNEYTAKELVNKTDEIAVIYASGEITMGKAQEGTITGDHFAKAVKTSREDSSVKAIVLRINSPGGSALASDIIWRELMLTKGVKPIIVSMGGVAASGGYYIACMADKIFANANTITGSIGVFGMLPYTGDFMTDKLGITFDGVSTTKYADLGSLNRKVTEYERQVIQNGVNKVYEDFVERVADGRSSTFDEIHAIAEGRVWSGTQALEVGLIDTIGGLKDAIKTAALMSGLEDYETIAYPKRKVEPWEILINNLDETVKTKLIGEDLMWLNKEFSALKQWITRKGVQVRLPYNIELN